MELVQCAMGDDYYQGPYCYEDNSGTHYVPRELYDKWKAAHDEWLNAQGEIEKYYLSVHRLPARKPSPADTFLRSIYDPIIAEQMRSK